MKAGMPGAARPARSSSAAPRPPSTPTAQPGNEPHAMCGIDWPSAVQKDPSTPASTQARRTHSR